MFRQKQMYTHRLDTNLRLNVTLMNLTANKANKTAHTNVNPK